MRPDKSNVLVSVEQNERGQFLKAIAINSKQIDNEVRQYLQEWSDKMNTPVIFVE
jgi:hypothetical protein